MTVHADADVQQQQEPEPLVPPRQERGSFLGRRLAFREPSPEELSHLLSPTEETTPAAAPGEESHAAEDVSGSAGPWSDESGQSDSADTSSPASGTRAGKSSTKFASEELRKTARNGVFLASVQAQRLLVRTQAQAELNLYIADDDDQANIGDPLADIAARRSGGAISDNPDVNSAIQALMGFGNYVVKQFQLSMIAKKYDAAAAAPEVIPGEVA